MPKTKAALTAKEAEFCRQYLVDLNAAQAALRAGYSQNTARDKAYEILERPAVAAEIARRQAEKWKRTDITVDRVLAEAARIAFGDIKVLFDESGNLKTLNMLDAEVTAAISSIEVVARSVPGSQGREVEYVHKIKAWDKMAALNLLARHLGILKDRVEHTGKDGGPIEVKASLQDLTDEQLLAIATGSGSGTSDP